MDTTRKALPLAEAARKRIRTLRTQRGLTQEALCERAGISVDAVSRIEGGSRIPTFETLERISGALDVGIGDLIGPGVLPKASHPPEVERIVTMLLREPPETRRIAEDVLKALLKGLRRGWPSRRR